MQGRLGDKQFPDLIRDLSQDNATGWLTLTHKGDTIKVYFESGAPTVAASSVPEHQLESKLVLDGLVSSDQIKAAWLAASDSSRSIDEVLVDEGAVTAEALLQTQTEVSRDVMNLAFEWYMGSYELSTDPTPPPGARLTWSAAECILSGARHASSN